MDMQGDFNDSAKKKPGEVIRALLGEATNEEYKAGIESHILQDQIEGFFVKATQVTQMYGVQVMRGLQQLAQELDAEGIDGAQRTEYMVSQLAHGAMIPDFVLPPEVADLAEMGVTTSSLRNFQGYVALHAVARAMDFAIEVSGLDEGRPLKVKVDITKGYDEGRAAHPDYYPELPELGNGATPPAATPPQEHKVFRPRGRFDL